MTTLIVSYDGTESDDDALALGQLLAQAGASLELAYVRHAHEGDQTRERLAEQDAAELLRAGAGSVHAPDAPQHIVVSASTPEGLCRLALERDADLIVFGSEYRTARGHVDPQASARRLLEGGPVALALAPSGFAQNSSRPATVAAVGDEGDLCPSETAESLARSLGARLTRPNRSVGLFVLGSKPGSVTGRLTVSAAAEYVIELATCPVIVLPRGVALHFG
jgi:nucleotide-binding universal stress UspA family protein